MVLPSPLVVKAAACSGHVSQTQHRIKGLLPWAPYPQPPQDKPSPASSASGEYSAGHGTLAEMLQRNMRVIAEEREPEGSGIFIEIPKIGPREGSNMGSEGQEGISVDGCPVRLAT